MAIQWLAFTPPEVSRFNEPGITHSYIRGCHPSSSNTQSLAQVFLFRRPLPSPSAAAHIQQAFPSLVPARTGLARAGLRNLASLEILLGIGGQSGFWGTLSSVTAQKY